MFKFSSQRNIVIHNTAKICYFFKEYLECENEYIEEFNYVKLDDTCIYNFWGFA